MPESAAFNGGKTWVLPKYRELTSSLRYVPDDEESPLYGGKVEIEVGHQPGRLTLELDADGNGRYDDPLDRILASEHVKPGGYSYRWDGNSADGKPVPRYTDVNLRVSFTGTGEVHWVLQDAERRLGGIAVHRLVGEPYDANGVAQADIVSWDDSYVDALDSGKCHKYTGTGIVADAEKLYTCQGAKPSQMKAIDLPSSQAKSTHGWGDTALTATWGDGRNIEDWQLTSQIVHSAIQHLSTDERASLEVAKDDGVEDAEPGDTLSYTLTVTNNHPWMFESSASLTDHLPPHTTFVAASDGGSYDSQRHSVNWPAFPLEGGETVRRSVSVTVDQDIEPGTNLTNFATVGGQDSRQHQPEPAQECPAPLCASDTDHIPAEEPVPLLQDDPPPPPGPLVETGGQAVRPLSPQPWAWSAGIGIGLALIAGSVAVVRRHFRQQP
jgi:uncharacterized repeat protein (TIGR01451 family)